MPRPKKPPGGKHSAHQVTFEPGQWEEVRSLLAEGESVSGVIQELLAAWLRRKKAEKAGEEMAGVKARLARLEGKDPAPDA